MQHLDKLSFTDKNLRPLIMLCVKIFILKQLEFEPHGLYQSGYFSAGSQQLVEDSMHKLLTELRPHMIPLVESFTIDVQDWNVCGNKYGDIYELPLDLAKRARINKDVVPPFYEKYMKPTMRMHKAKL